MKHRKEKRITTQTAIYSTSDITSKSSAARIVNKAFGLTFSGDVKHLQVRPKGIEWIPYLLPAITKAIRINKWIKWNDAASICNLQINNVPFGSHYLSDLNRHLGTQRMPTGCYSLLLLIFYCALAEYVKRLKIDGKSVLFIDHWSYWKGFAGKIIKVTKPNTKVFFKQYPTDLVELTRGHAFRTDTVNQIWQEEFIKWRLFNREKETEIAQSESSVLAPRPYMTVPPPSGEILHNLLSAQIEIQRQKIIPIIYVESFVDAFCRNGIPQYLSQKAWLVDMALQLWEAGKPVIMKWHPNCFNESHVHAKVNREQIRCVEKSIKDNGGRIDYSGFLDIPVDQMRGLYDSDGVMIWPITLQGTIAFESAFHRWLASAHENAPYPKTNNIRRYNSAKDVAEEIACFDVQKIAAHLNCRTPQILHDFNQYLQCDAGALGPASVQRNLKSYERNISLPQFDDIEEDKIARGIAKIWRRRYAEEG